MDGPKAAWGRCGGVGSLRSLSRALPLRRFGAHAHRGARASPAVSSFCLSFAPLLLSRLFPHFSFPYPCFCCEQIPPRGAVALSVAAALRPLPSRRARLPPVRSRCASSRRPRLRSSPCFTAARRVSWYRCLALILAGSPGTSTCPSTSGRSGRVAATRVRPPPSTRWGDSTGVTLLIKGSDTDINHLALSWSQYLCCARLQQQPQQ